MVRPSSFQTTPTLEPEITVAAIGDAFRVAWIDDRDGVNALYVTTCK